jgi:endonuclease-3
VFDNRTSTKTAKARATASGKSRPSAGGRSAKAFGGSRKTGGRARTGRAHSAGASRKAKGSGGSPGAGAAAGRAVRKIIGLLEKAYPQSKIALDFSNPLELLVATVLAAQCTDERVNQVTKNLFKKYRKAGDYAEAPLDDLMEAVRPTGFFRNKSKNIRAACLLIETEHGGVVPNTMDELVGLPGVARKTANIVLGNAYGIASRRLGLTEEEDPVKVEKDLCEIVPKKEWIHFPQLIATHGRAICKARSPRCMECVLGELCPSRDFYIGRAATPASGARRKTKGAGGTGRGKAGRA